MNQSITVIKKFKRTGDKGEGRPSRMEETAYLARLFMSLTHCSVNKNEATGLVANPGAIRSRCETSFPAGAPQRCRRKVDWVDAQRCRARRTAHGWVESWSRGQKSQLASRACSGGVSAVMGTSDFDAHTFAQQGWFAIGVKAHCP